jgi:hypothetical protein
MTKDIKGGQIIAITNNVMSIQLYCHPLTAKVLAAHYGHDGVVMSGTDPLFDLIGTKSNTLSAASAKDYVEPVTFFVNEKLARVIQSQPLAIAHKLFRYHKHQMCWFVATHVRVQGKGAAKQAVYDWMHLHGISEEDYSSETLYKTFQRFGWNFDKKKVEISGQLRNQRTAILSPKSRAKWGSKTPKRPTETDSEVELAVANFLATYQRTFRTVPVLLHKHARIFFYLNMQDLSFRCAAKKLGVSCNGVHIARKSMLTRINKNKAVRDMVTECLKGREVALFA